MNMQRMLNVLILIFLTINLALYFYIDNQQAGKYTLSSERESQLHDVLEVNGIGLYATLPENYPRPRLIVFPPVDDTESKLLDRMFGDEARESTYTEELHTHETVSGRLRFDQGADEGRIYYGAKKVKYIPSVYNKASYDALVSGFVGDLTLDNEGFVLTDSRDSGEEGSIIYYFNEMFKNELLFCNEVVVKLKKEVGITEARTIRYVPYAFEEQADALVAVDEVIYNLMIDLIEEAGSFLSITDVDIGYFLGPDDRNDLSSLAIEPYYRIKLGTGEAYYINAYTNEIVQ